MPKTNRLTNHRLTEVLVTLQFSAAYLQKDFLPCDATTRQELEFLNLSYNSNNSRFAAAKAGHFNWYLCPRCSKLGLHKANEYLRKLLGVDTNLVCYLRKHNPKVIGYGWSKEYANKVNLRLRKHFMAAILEGKTEITLFIPEKLLTPEYLHEHK